MSIKTVLDYWERNGIFETPVFSRDAMPCRPGPEVVGLIVAWDRELRQLSVEALASLAGVSVSSIERIERCEQVSEQVLRPVAAALGRDEGAFVDERIQCSPEEAFALLEDSVKWIDGTVSVSVEPLRTHRQIRALTNAACINVDVSRLRDGLDEAAENVKEWLGLISFLRAEQAGLIDGGHPDRIKFRALSEDALKSVRDVERLGFAVGLAGTYEAKVTINGQLAKDTMTAGVIAFFPKSTDPCAVKRAFLRAPETIELMSVV